MKLHVAPCHMEYVILAMFLACHRLVRGQVVNMT